MVLKRYHDMLSDGVPREALAEIGALKTIKEGPVQKLVEVYTRGKELIVVLESPGDLPFLTLELLFSH